MASLQYPEFRSKSITAIICLLVYFTMTASLTARAGIAQGESFEQSLQAAEQAIQANKFKEAYKHLKQAIEINKRSAEAHLYMGLVYKNLGNRKEGIKHLYRSLEIQPDKSETHYLMAVLLLETNEPAQAEAELNKAIQLGLKTFNGFALKGQLELTDRNFQGALEYFEKALQQNSGNQADVDGLRLQTDALKSFTAFRDRPDKSGYTTPRPISHSRPNFTEDARRNKIQGVVRMYVLVDETGMVKSVLVTSRLGYGLDEEAIAAVSRLRFQPASKNGNPVPYWSPMEVEFVRAK
jgi:TonB family protein